VTVSVRSNGGMCGFLGSIGTGKNDGDAQLVDSGLGIAALVPETATLERLFSQLTENAQTDVPAAACAPDRQP
jgi:hypothetical protein